MLAFAERFLAAGAGSEGGTDEAERLRPALAHFAAWLDKEGLAEDAVGQGDLERYLYHLALEGANSARLDQAVDALKGYFAYRAKQLGPATQAGDGPGAARQSDGQNAARQSDGQGAARQSDGPGAALQSDGQSAALQSDGQSAARQPDGQSAASQSADAVSAPPNPAACLTHFGESEAERDRYIQAQWALSDAFYGIRPQKEKGNA